MDLNATVTERVEVTPGLIIIRVVPDEPLAPFEAGQYLVLGLKRNAPRVAEADPEEIAVPANPDHLIRRAYSVASSSRSGEYAEFYISLVTSGELTPRIFAVPVGGRIYMTIRAKGIFTLSRIPPHVNALLVATGTGLAPYMSMLRSELIAGVARRFVVLHGARVSWDLGYRQELSALAHRFPQLTYLPVISRPLEDPSWSGPSGYLQDFLFSGVVEREAGLAITPQNFHVFLCGNPAMIDAATVRLTAIGFEPGRAGTIGTLHTEVYW